jgi:GT2 family glycosyltransferase
VEFSIIIPSLNASSLIDDAISSIVAQGFRAEIIVIDGGSTDDTVAKVRARAAVSICVSEPDRGIFEAINKGLALATGGLIGVLGADDRYLPGAFAATTEVLRSSSAEIVAGASRLVREDGSSSLRADEPYGEGALISGIPFCHNAMFATQEAYRRVGSYDAGYRLCADAQWVHRAIRLGLNCERTPEVVVEFSLSGKSSVQSERIMAETYQTIAENFPGLSVEDAKALLYAARKWGPTAPVVDILLRNPNDEALWRAVRAALPETAEAARSHTRKRRAAKASRSGLLESVKRLGFGRKSTTRGSGR